MTDLKISDFANGGAVQTTDEVAAVRGGINTKVFFGSMAAETASDYGKLSTANTWSNTNIFTQVNTATIQAVSSSGTTFKTNGGTDWLHGGNGGSANATAYGGWNFDSATADRIAGFGPSKTLVSLDTATYPSLTELAYVKGVTSAIQTQLNGKQASITPAALTKSDDTNVTLTLGGSPSTALLAAASLTLGWTGLLSTARGGTGVGTSTGSGNNVLSDTPTLATPNFTGNPTGTIGRGTYTPTLTNVANVAASTAYVTSYGRIGDMVWVAGGVDIDPTSAAGTETELGISLPIASNFAAARECAGNGSFSAVSPTVVASVLADSTNDRARINFKSSFTTNENCQFFFMYRVI